MICLAKFGLNPFQLQNPISENTTLSMVVYLKFLGQLNFIGVHPNPDAKFAKMKSQKGQVLGVNDEKLTASSFLVHSHAQQRCFQQTLRFDDVLADYRTG